MAQTSESLTTPHIAIIPTPGMGHLIPLTELARRLTELNLSVTFLIPNDGSPPTNAQLSLLQTLPTSVSHRFLPPDDVSDTPPDEARISLTLTRSVSALRDSLRVLSDSTRLVALVVDLLGTPVFYLAREFGISPYIFFIGSAHSLCCAFSLLDLDKMYRCEYRDLPEPIEFFPGCVPVHGVDFPDPVQDKGCEAYKQIMKIIGHYHEAAGIMVNSFLDLEPTYFKHLMKDGMENKIPPIYPVGPVIHIGSRGDGPDESGCLRWLDEQPVGSVLFVSFGSGGTLSHEQLIELALGLEMSGQKFLWACRSPNNKIANGDYFTAQRSNDPFEFLPEGFLERTNSKGFGFIVPSWAPQIRILSHESTGGFLTHCGWNSTLESLAYGVPLIAWPLYAEQRLNSVLLSEDLKVALRVKPNVNGLIGREQIADYVQRLIQGEEGQILRDKMKVLKDATVRVSSEQSLDKVAQLWKNQNTS